ncbi:hypothetical protein [Pedobacter gandavensis]|uniref:Uncharacterized protein n=1 Tax=Pedobacter gandavensis TaxID=2679963 RepID=A0ABR6EV76_9SPHI|nr:hypothetical protein [Pedobacter gandavensis]MBB2149175.1 hypothetical protein [Pedobacter gandavensis]
MNKAFKTLKEYTALIVAVLLFFVSPFILHYLDPVAATYDAGVFQVINLAVIQFCVYMAITWTVVKNIWPAIGQYFKTSFNHDFKDLSKWQKVSISLSVYFLVFLFLVLLSRVFMTAG